MKTALRIGVLSILSLSTLPLLAQRQGFTYDRLLERFDADGDGIVATDEFDGNPRMFERMDTDKDGSVSRDEFDAAMKTRNKRPGQRSRFEQGRDRYAAQGLQAGQKIPDLTVYDLKGNPHPLSSLWKDRPVVLATASATCPISVGSCPSLKPLSETYSTRVNVAVLYVKEAHPIEDDSPATSQRPLGARSHPQPETFQEKLKLAKLFDREIRHGGTIYVDDLENSAGQALGAGPNIGLLIGTDGRIILRQGWYDAKGMEDAIEKLDGGQELRDIEYAVADGESLKLDLYLPQATNSSPPLVVWIHGGGWKNGDKAKVNPAILRLVDDGYAVASINYRLKDLSIHPKNIHDCKGAIRWLRVHAATYGYDPERIAVGGGSAGGHLALLLGLGSGVDALEGTVGGNTGQSSAVRAIIDLYGPSELNIMADAQERFNRAHDFDPEQLAEASPLNYLTQDDPPVLIFHGDQDRTVPVGQSILLHERYRQLGLESELHILEGAGHGGREFSAAPRYRQIKAFLDRYLKGSVGGIAVPTVGMD